MQAVSVMRAKEGVESQSSVNLRENCGIAELRLSESEAGSRGSKRAAPEKYPDLDGCGC